MKENTDTNVFEGFPERHLLFCGRYPEPRSVIFMDNASFHFSARIDKLLLFRSIKNRTRKMSREDADLIQGNFMSYLRMQINIMYL